MKKYFFWALLVLSCSTFFGQAPLGDDVTGELDKMVNIPNSPEAEAFSQYGNTAVSLYTGTPNKKDKFEFIYQDLGAYTEEHSSPHARHVTNVVSNIDELNKSNNIQNL